MVTDAPCGEVPVCRGVLCPRARVRLVLKIGRKDVPVLAEDLCELAPRLLYLLFREAQTLVVPESGTGPRVALDAMARDHDQNASFGRFRRNLGEHRNVSRLEEKL
eukprot:1884274-Prymnesium_polylepis.1